MNRLHKREKTAKYNNFLKKLKKFSNENPGFKVFCRYDPEFSLLYKKGLFDNNKSCYEKYRVVECITRLIREFLENSQKNITSGIDKKNK